MRVESEKATKKKGRFWKILLILLLIAAVGFAGYKGVQKALLAANYDQATELLAQGKLDEAAELFAAAEDYMDAREQASKLFYEQAEAYLAEGKVTYAAIAFGKAGDYLDARERAFALWDLFADREVVRVNAIDGHVAVRPDGTSIHTELEYTVDPQYAAYHPEYDVEPDAVDQWTEIIAVDGGFTVVGLKADGTVVDNNKPYDVSDWTDIVDICAGVDYILGLKSDGTVVAEGEGEHGQTKVEEWTDIIDISAGPYHVMGLRADGTVVTAGCELPKGWPESDMQYIDYGQCEVSGWEDIVRICPGNSTSVGIKADGTCVMVGDSDDLEGLQMELGYHFNKTHSNVIYVTQLTRAALFADGTVASEWLVGGREEWHGLVVLDEISNGLLGVRSHGTIVVDSPNEWQQGATDGWVVKVPAVPDFALIAAGFAD